MATDFNADQIRVSLPLRDVLGLYEGLRAIDSKFMIAFGDVRRDVCGIR